MNAPSSSLACAVLTVSNHRTAGNDTSGNILTEHIAHAGHECAARDIVAEDIYQIRRVFSNWIADPRIEVIISNGGTGFSMSNNLPEAVAPLLDQEIDGFGELFRRLSFDEIGSAAIQSRALAGYANRTLIFCVPGSNNAVSLAWESIIGPQLNIATGPCNFASKFKKDPRGAKTGQRS